MNSKNIFSGILFLICIISTILYFLLDVTLEFLDDISTLLLLGGILSYVTIYFSFVVVFQHYSKLKRFFYDGRIKYIRNSINRQNKLSDDIGGIFFLSLVINFFSVYFLLITTPNQIISRIPGFEGVTLFSEDTSVDLFEIVGSVTRIDYFLPFTVIGVTVFFILRFIRLRRINNSEEGVPGTNPLLAFMYAVFGIIVIQSILLAFNIVDLGIDAQTFIIRILFAGIFTIMGVLGIMVAMFLDFFLLRSLKLK